MKKILYILIGLLIAFLVYITFLSEIPDINIPETVIAQEYVDVDVNVEGEHNFDGGEGVTDEDLEIKDEDSIFTSYRVGKSDLDSKDLGVGKDNPMYFKKEVIVVENTGGKSDLGNGGSPSIGNGSKPSLGSSNPITIKPQLESDKSEDDKKPIEETKVPEIKKPDIVVNADNDEIKEVIDNLDKEQVKNNFTPIEISQFMKSLNNKRNEGIEQIVELSYVCKQCGELFLLPLDSKNISIPKVYGQKEEVKHSIYTNMDVVLKENEGFAVYSQSKGVVESIELEEKGCVTVVIEHDNKKVTYEHLSLISNILEVGKEIGSGEIIGEVQADGGPKGLNYNIKVDVGGYLVNSNVFIVTEEPSVND